MTLIKGLYDCAESKFRICKLKYVDHQIWEISDFDGDRKKSRRNGQASNVQYLYIIAPQIKDVLEKWLKLYRNAEEFKKE